VTHECAQPLLLDLAYSELAPEEARQVECHAGECAACAAELAGLRETRQLAARLADEQAPERGRDELVAAARRAVAAPPARWWTRARIYAVTASAAVVVAVAGVTLRLGGGAGPGPPQPAGVELAMPGTVSGEAGSREPGEVVASARTQARTQVALDATQAEMAPAPAAPTAKVLPAAPIKPAAPKAAAPSPAPEAEGRVLEAWGEGARPLQAEGAVRQRQAAVPQGPATAARGAAADTLAGPRAGDDPVVAAVERRIAAGELEERSRRLSCGGVTVERTSWLDGELVAKLAVREPGRGLVEAWYDGAGRLRAVRRGGVGRAAIAPGAAGEGGAASTGLPDRAPSSSGLERCGW